MHSGMLTGTTAWMTAGVWMRKKQKSVYNVYFLLDISVYSVYNIVVRRKDT